MIWYWLRRSDMWPCIPNIAIWVVIFLRSLCLRVRWRLDNGLDISMTYIFVWYCLRYYPNVCTQNMINSPTKFAIDFLICTCQQHDVFNCFEVIFFFRSHYSQHESENLFLVLGQILVAPRKYGNTLVANFVCILFLRWWCTGETPDDLVSVEQTLFVIAIGDYYRFAFFGLVTKLWLKFQGLFY